MGVNQFPFCTKGIICKYLANVLSYAIDIPFIQKHIAPA